MAALKRKRVEADERPPAPAPPPAPVRTHDSMGTEWHSIHISMLGEYIPIYKSSVRDASSMVAEAECELEEARKAEERLESALIAAQLACDRQEKRPEPHRSPLMLDAEWEEWEAARDAWMERLRAHQAAQREADWARDDARYALHDAKPEVRYALRSLESAKAKECCNLEELHDFVDAGSLLVSASQRPCQSDLGRCRGVMSWVPVMSWLGPAPGSGTGHYQRFA